MIKPRAQPSYFELEAEDKEWNSTGLTPPCSQSLQLKSPSTGDTSFGNGQSGSTSFDKQGYTICIGQHSCQFHWCESTFHQQ